MYTLRRNAAKSAFLALAVVGQSTALLAKGLDRIDYVVALSTGELLFGPAEIQVPYKNEDAGPTATGLRCVLKQEPDTSEYSETTAMTVEVEHPVESGDYRYRLKFNLTQGALTDQRIESIILAGRSYHYQLIQSRMLPLYDASPPDVVVGFGIDAAMVRPDETYPWLPVEYLLPQFYEVDDLMLGLSGYPKEDDGNDKRQYQMRKVDVGDLKEAMTWCHRFVNPSNADSILLAEPLEAAFEK